MHLRGTIRTSPQFDDETAAESIEKAMRQKDNDKIIRVLTGICNAQRQMIRTPYKVRYGKDLEAELKKHLSGDLEDFIIALIQTPTKQDVLELQRAVKGLGTDEKLLIEIITTRSNAELEAIRNVYHATYGRTLEAAIAGDTSGDFKRMLIAMIQGNRDETESIDQYRAAEIARAMLASKDSKSTGKIEAYSPLITSNPSMIEQIAMEYQKLTGTSLIAAVSKDFSGDIKNLLLSNVALMNGRQGYYVEVLKTAKSPKDFTRILINRAETDLRTIADMYQQSTGKPLQEVVLENAKGDMRTAYMAIIKGN